ncbi:MAG: hypothetical protein KHY61_10495, partial [Sutterella wadsworthensis]|nr:hypothetical protein [Sutterella wadsworthensis]
QRGCGEAGLDFAPFIPSQDEVDQQMSALSLLGPVGRSLPNSLSGLRLSLKFRDFRRLRFEDAHAILMAGFLTDIF